LFALLTGLLIVTSGNVIGQGLSLDEALRLAGEQSPQVASQRALAEGARTGAIAAGALPDPKFTIKLENLATTTNYRWTFRDYSTGMRYGFKQEFPWGEKLTYRTQVAQQEAERESVAIDVQRATVQRNVAMAWVARYFAEQAEAAVAAQIAEAELAVSAGNAQYRAGALTQRELVALQKAVVDLENRRTDLALQVKRAKIAMSRYIGTESDRSLAGPPDVTRQPLAMARLSNGAELPEVRAALSQEAVTAAQTNAALGDYGPDAEVTVSWLDRGASGDVVQYQPGHPLQPQTRYSDLITFEVETTLPIFPVTRQTPRVQAMERLLDAARADREEAQRRETARVQDMMAVWDTHRAETMRIRDELVPLAVQRREAALAAYRGGTGTLDDVLKARRGELDVRLRLVEHQQQAASAWAWLEYVFPIADQRQ
jgi:outer membrane protein TolC